MEQIHGRVAGPEIAGWAVPRRLGTSHKRSPVAAPVRQRGATRGIGRQVYYTAYYKIVTRKRSSNRKASDQQICSGGGI